MERSARLAGCEACWSFAHSLTSVAVLQAPPLSNLNWSRAEGPETEHVVKGRHRTVVHLADLPAIALSAVW